MNTNFHLGIQLLAMVPHPVKAVVLLFPISKEYEEKRKEEDAKIAKDGQPAIDPTILWIKQTVRPCLQLEISCTHAFYRLEMPAGPWVSFMLWRMCVSSLSTSMPQLMPVYSQT